MCSDRAEPVGQRPAGHVLLASPRGYCAGVDRAVVTVERALDLYGPPLYVRKEIVHNSQVVARLAGRGVVFVPELDLVPPGARVVFSAHGIAPAVRDQAAALGLLTIDATCPLVTKVHREVGKFAARDLSIVLVGHAGHEEVEGTAGEAPNRITVVSSPGQVDQIELKDESKVAWLSQTTLSVDETAKVVSKLRHRFPALTDPPSDDICYATQNRQNAVKLIAGRAEVVVVVGSANSSNSVRLVEVALENGAAAAHRVDSANELDPAWLAGVKVVGLTSGASVPEVLVDEVLARLAELGFGQVEEVATSADALAFALPRELRLDLVKAGLPVEQLPHRA
ncbi:MAG: 4-hydroxy-3-methylbut-2-enyl diphosphate reductase [Micrococcales bacterium]|nr:4-hydroxy-3-methylbut-2-enyl diphosphate reductase [Micrococcales bacterium]